MPEASLRIDKWLWHARFFKTRSLATKVVAGGSVRINGTHVKKPSATVKADDTLTFPKEQEIRVIRILALGERRGPASEAQELYEDLSPPAPKERKIVHAHPDRQHSGRPTKKLRRTIDTLKGSGP